MRSIARALVAIALVGSSLVAPATTPSVAAATPSGTWSVIREVRISPRPTSTTNRAREPIVAAHPFDASRVAVVYPIGGEASTPVVRISHDGGVTWRTIATRPRGGGSHPMVAWGPGPRPGSARLYYAAMGGSAGNYHWIVSYTDNEGVTWRQGFIADHTRGWFGGMADLVVDTNRASPNYGVLYLAYNWPKDLARGDGLRVVVSSDYGRSEVETEIPQLPGPTGYGDYWRIGYKLATAPDGAAYVAGYQLDMKVWLASSPFRKGGSTNIGRIGFGVARIVYNRANRTISRGANVLATTLPKTAWNLGWVLQGVNVGLAEPCWATGLVVDSGGRIYYAVGGDGRIRILTSDDRGRTWRLQYLPGVPAANGRAQLSMRPDLVVGRGFVAVLFHSVDASGTAKTAGTTAAVSFDRGATWVGPRAITRGRWAIDRIIAQYNGPGLRDRAVLLADGRTIYFGYGDGRDGYSAAYGTRLLVTVPTPPPPPPPPPPSPSPSPDATPSPAGSAAPTPPPSADPAPPATPSPPVDPPPAPSASAAPSGAASPSDPPPSG